MNRDWERCVRLQALASELERARNASDDAAMVKACMDLVGLHGGRVRPPRLDVDPAVIPRLRMAIQRLRADLGALQPSPV